MVDLLGIPDAPEQITRAQLLRQALRDAIDRLRPDESIPFGRPEWLGYRVLWLRYVECLDQPDVCEEVAFSRAAFYRHHREALDAVTSLLWTQYQASRSASAMPEEPESPPAHEHALSEDPPAAETARIASTRLFTDAATWESVDVKAVLVKVGEILAPLLAQQTISLHTICPASLPAVDGDPALLRQILLNVLTEGIRLAAGDRLYLEAQAKRGDIVWRLCGIRSIDERQLDSTVGLTVSKELLDACGGRLWIDATGVDGFALCVTIPVRATQEVEPSIVLIIDDDMDTVELYRRYLQAHRYRVLVAHNSCTMREILAESSPDLVLLDVLMPGEDGWDILGYIRITPESADIPVIICSVLHQANLALASGATAVLQKPIDQATLLRTIRKILEGDSEPKTAQAAP
jgi:CheY-like chemotaxis protein